MNRWIGRTTWALAAVVSTVAIAGDVAFHWRAHPVVIPPGHTARLTLDLHVPAGVDDIEYDLDVAGPEGDRFVVGEPEKVHGRWERAAWRRAHAGMLVVHLPMSAPGAEPGLHHVMLQARIRTCTGRACVDGKEAEVPVIVHVLEQTARVEQAAP